MVRYFLIVRLSPHCHILVIVRYRRVLCIPMRITEVYFFEKSAGLSVLKIKVRS